jgi:hypothetical protein
MLHSVHFLTYSSSPPRPHQHIDYIFAHRNSLWPILLTVKFPSHADLCAEQVLRCVTDGNFTYTLTELSIHSNASHFSPVQNHDKHKHTRNRTDENH